MRRYRSIALILTGILFLGGCASPLQETAGKAAEKPQLLGLRPDFSYTVPESVPFVVTDQAGYLVSVEKKAIFLGTEVPDSFEIRNADTEEIVYRGKISAKGKDQETGKEVSIGTFSDFQTEGSYYIRCDTIGCSYPFRIGNDCYEEVMEDLLTKLGKADDSMTADDEALLAGGLSETLKNSGTVVTGCETADMMMLAYELYPDYFDRTLEGTAGGVRIPAVLEAVRNETDWMMTMQDPNSGGIYAGAVQTKLPDQTEKQQKQAQTQAQAPIYTDKDISYLSTASFAAAMAGFSYLYAKYDTAYAAKCTQAAELAWNYLEKHPETEAHDASARFYAAAQLFRLTQKTAYRSAAEEKVAQRMEEPLDEFSFLGMVTYLSTTGKVDKELCSEMIQLLMKDSEHIADQASESLFLADADGSGTQVQNILWNMVRLSVVDYVITNHEYSTVIENNVHYLLGANPDAACMLPGMGARNLNGKEAAGKQITSLPEQAQLLFLLSVVTSEHEMIITS